MSSSGIRSVLLAILAPVVMTGCSGISTRTDSSIENQLPVCVRYEPVIGRQWTISEESAPGCAAYLPPESARPCQEPQLVYYDTENSNGQIIHPYCLFLCQETELAKRCVEER